MILDALKRAERERKLEKGPDLSAIYQYDQPDRPNYRKWFWAGGAFLCMAGVVLFLVWPKGPGKTDLSAKNAKAVQTASKPAAPSPQKSVQAPKKNVQTAKPAALKTAQKGASPSQAPPPSKKPPQKPAPAPENAAPEPQKAPPRPQPVKKSPRELSDRVFTAGAVKEKPVAAPEQNLEPDPGEDIPQAGKPSKKALPSFNDLPEEILSVSGPLEINVHVYSDKPAERRVFINMKSYREGDAIEETGYKVVKITSNGAVIDYGKGQALLEVSGK